MPLPKHNSRFSFSLRESLAWITVFAVSLGILSLLPSTSFGAVAWLGVTAGFVLFDVLTTHRRAPCRVRGVAYFSAGITYSASASLTLFVLFFDPATPPKPPVPLLQAVYELFTMTGWVVELRELVAQIAEVIAVIYLHLLVIFSLSTLGFSLAVISYVRTKNGLGVVALNAPGFLLLVYFLISSIVGALHPT